MPKIRVISEHAVLRRLPYNSVGETLGSSGCSVALSRSGSREVWSLVMDEALALRMELASVAEAAALRNGIETPETEEADEASPGWRCMPLSR